MKPNYQIGTFIGWIALILISLVPAFLWLTVGPGISDFNDYGSITHSLGEIFGLVGMTMFALTFVLSMRIKFLEDIFGGLDKVYIVHGILGSLALILILAHPIFLVLKFIPQNMNLAATYLLPSAYWSVNFGIIALVSLVILIFITLYTKMKYRTWKFTHEFLGLVFVLAVLHIFMVRGTVSSDNIFNGYYYYASAVTVIGLGAFSYSLFIKDRWVMNAVYKIKSIDKSKNVFVLEMVSEYKPLKYQSGQFVFLRFYNQNISKEAHPFSIASKSNSAVLKVVVKKLGDFTNKMDYLKEGDKVSIEGPYGRFNYKNYNDRNQIWIAAGIGITPFLGMVQDLETNSDSTVHLYYTAKDDSGFIGYNLFSEAAKKIKGFKFFPWNSTTSGHLNVEAIKKTSGSLKDCEFLICGSEKLKQDLTEQLAKEGVKMSRIHEEAFDFK